MNLFSKLLPFNRTHVVLVSLLIVLLSSPEVQAQRQSTAQETDILTVEDQPTFISGVKVVTVPVTVTGPNGEYVTALTSHDFKIFDNEVEQEIDSVEVSFLPVSMVICVQSSDRVEAILPDIKKTAVLFTDMVLGRFGEGALLAFDSRLRLMTDFTNDTKKIDGALKKITVGSSAVRLADAVYEGMRMLRRRPGNHRKIIVVLSESQNNGSEVDMGEVLRSAQLENIMIYPVRISTLAARVLRGQKPTPSPFPAGVETRPIAPGQVSTPTTMQQSRVNITGNVVPLVIDLVRGVKNLVFQNPLEALAKATGGKDYSPRTESGLQRSIVQIGEDLRSQYLLTYRPNNLNKHGIYHRIRVSILYDALNVRARIGYFHGPQPVFVP